MCLNDICSALSFALLKLLSSKIHIHLLLKKRLERLVDLGATFVVSRNIAARQKLRRKTPSVSKHS